MQFTRERWNEFVTIVFDTTMRPEIGPQYGLPVPLLEVVEAMTLHPVDAQRLAEDQMAIFGAIPYPVEIDWAAVWRQLAVTMLDMYQGKMFEWETAQNKVPDVLALNPITVLRRLLDHTWPRSLSEARDLIAEDPSPHTFTRALCDSIFAAQSKSASLAIMAFNEHPLVRFDDTVQLQDNFKSVLRAIPYKSSPMQPVQYTHKRLLQLRH